MLSRSPAAGLSKRPHSGFQQQSSSGAPPPVFRASQGSNATEIGRQNKRDPSVQHPAPVLMAEAAGRSEAKVTHSRRNVNESDELKSARSSSSGKKNARDVLWSTSPEKCPTTTSSESAKNCPVTPSQQPSRLRQPLCGSPRAMSNLSRGTKDRARDVPARRRPTGVTTDTCTSLGSILPENIWDNIDVFHEEVEEAVRGQRERRKSAEEMMSEQEYSEFLQQQEEEENNFWSSLETKELALQRLVTNMQLLRYDNNPAAFTVSTKRDSIVTAPATSSSPKPTFSPCGFSHHAPFGASASYSANASPQKRSTSMQDFPSSPMLGGKALPTMLREQLLQEESRAHDAQEQVRALEAQRVAYEAQVQAELRAVREEIQVQKEERERLEARQHEQRANTTENDEISRLKESVRAVRQEAANALGELQAAHERELELATAQYQQELQRARGRHRFKSWLNAHDSLEDSPTVLREERRNAVPCSNVSPCFGTRSELGDDDTNGSDSDVRAIPHTARDVDVQHLMHELRTKERTIQHLITAIRTREPEKTAGSAESIAGGTKVVKYSLPVQGPGRKDGKSVVRAASMPRRTEGVVGEDALLAAIQPLRVLSASSLHGLMSPRDDAVTMAGQAPLPSMQRTPCPPPPAQATPRTPLALVPTSSRSHIHAGPSQPTVLSGVRRRSSQLLTLHTPHFPRAVLAHAHTHVKSATSMGTSYNAYCTPRHYGNAATTPRSLASLRGFGVMRQSVPHLAQSLPPSVNRPSIGRAVTPPTTHNSSRHAPHGLTRNVSAEASSTTSLHPTRASATTSSLSTPFSCPPRMRGSLAMPMHENRTRTPLSEKW